MIRLTLINNYYYTEQAKDITYYVCYKLLDVLYTTILDCQIDNTDAIIEYVIDNYNAMMWRSDMSNRPLLIVEEVVEEDTLTDAVALLKQAARKAMLSDDQETEIIEKVCGWAGQGSYQQDPSLPQGYEGRTVVAYPYTPGYTLGLEHHTLCNTPHSLHAVEVCGIPTVLVETEHRRLRSYTATQLHAQSRLCAP